jgi:hypothetical protein
MSKFSLELIEEYPYQLYGITASAHDYRLCWHLNKELGLKFTRQEAIEIFNKRKESVNHEFFTYEDQESVTKYRLIQNKRTGSTFLPEITEADYLLVIDESPVVDYDALVRKIKNIRPVLMVFPINLDLLKNKQNLLLTA